MMLCYILSTVYRIVVIKRGTRYGSVSFISTLLQHTHTHTHQTARHRTQNIDDQNTNDASHNCNLSQLLSSMCVVTNECGMNEMEWVSN